MWEWTPRQIAIMLRMDSKYIPPEWLWRLQFKLWPQERHQAIPWVLAHLVLYRSQQRCALTLQDYMDFLRRMKWKIYQQKSRTACVGNYLRILDPNV
jgi:hypothetical protein